MSAGVHDTFYGTQTGHIQYTINKHIIVNFNDVWQMMCRTFNLVLFEICICVYDRS